MALIHRCDSCCKTIADGNMIEIATPDNSLIIRNNILGYHHKRLLNYADMHFCSKKCFTDYFFEPIIIPDGPSLTFPSSNSQDAPIADYTNVLTFNTK